MLLEGEHGGEHELGDRDRRRAACVRHCPTVEQLAREAVDTGAGQVHPPDTLRVLEGVGPPAAEQDVGVQVGRRRVGARVDDLDVGHSRFHRVGGLRSELVDHPHAHERNLRQKGRVTARVGPASAPPIRPRRCPTT
jgi:hypothetical protein